MSEEKRECIDCGADLSGTHGKTKRCRPCAEKAKKASNRKARLGNFVTTSLGVGLNDRMDAYIKATNPTLPPGASIKKSDIVRCAIDTWLKKVGF